MKKILLTFIVLFLITLPTLLPFFNTKFFYTQDHIFIARINQLSTALSDGHFPVRWAPDLRFGEPIFNFYAPLPYYLGAIINFFGVDIIWTSKLLFILSTYFSAITMYIFSKHLFSKSGAILATVLYIYAPYRAVDIYVRGAFSEVWAFVFFPLIFYTSALLAEKVNLKRMAYLALSLAGLFLTHNVTTLIFLPFLALWWLYLVLKHKSRTVILPFAGSFVLSLGLSVFFLLPALFERQFIQTKYLLVGYFDFRAHFVAFYQFFSPIWGYGSSLWGPIDDMSFQIGLAHWATLVLALILGLLFRKDQNLLPLFCLLGFSFLLSIFLQHNKSAFVWEAIPLMAFIQFPWRFLAISIFIISITGAAIGEIVMRRFKIVYYVSNKLVYFLLIASVVLINLSYFRPRNYVDDDFFEKFLNKEKMHQGIDLTKDYFPIWVKNDRVEYFGSPRAVKGEIAVLNFEKKTASAKGSINVISDSRIELPITYFPGWEVKANRRVLNLSEPSIQGLITFELPKGEYQIDLELKDTPVRIMGNILSIVSLLLLLVLLGHKKFGYAKSN